MSTTACCSPIFGPLEERPPLPVFDSEFMPDATRKPFSLTTPCNWLQVYENTQDPIHLLHLHARSGGVQFGVASGIDQVIEYQDTPLGMMNVQTRPVGERVWVRTVDSILPNVNQTGAIWEEAEASKAFQRCAMLRWMVPVDDAATRTIGWRFFSARLDPRGQDQPERVGRESIDFVGQTEDERPYAERQRQPGDFEAQVSQRPIAIQPWSTAPRPTPALRDCAGSCASASFVKLRLPEAKVKEVESPARDWQDLLSGRVDVTISSILEAGKLSSTHEALVIPFQTVPTACRCRSSCPRTTTCGSIA